jgi:hypothetical protein
LFPAVARSHSSDSRQKMKKKRTFNGGSQCVET